MPDRSARALAAEAIREWRSGQRFADSVIQEKLAASHISGSDRAFAVELFYGVLRNLTLLDFWISLLRSSGLDDDSRDLLRLGLYQLFVLRTPAHAAVFETVAISPKRRRPLVNGILRAALRKAAELAAAAAAAPIGRRFSHPEFLVHRWTRHFGADAAAALCEWDNQPAPVYARVQTLVISVDEFLAAHPGSEPVAGKPRFVRLARVPADALARGECYIQDPSTSTACELLDPQPGDTLLDVCAAPGGKTGFMAELMQNRGRIVACDRDSSRLERLRGNLQRLRVTIASAIQHDWRSGPLPESAGATFDRILIDAPCTNTGVLRRRVDARWRLSPHDFARMPNEQFQIVSAVLSHLKAGGALVYSTCSIEPEENERVVERLLQAYPFLELEAQQSVLPFRDGFDGAFAAKLRRR
ncbi:MAG: 16S rRNA (cytosine(967)-C(5))-methyltransferase RsmB, partial [Verrucomicrobiota bacterium]|nr:16S rRNA (cytosine(967)-C(5))-methyltransferase RsmB [Verrucomicrobiota bacterium]